jgi:FKBP-type peptidyl-prolyl cis-trans isomerase
MSKKTESKRAKDEEEDLEDEDEEGTEDHEDEEDDGEEERPAHSAKSSHDRRPRARAHATHHDDDHGHGHDHGDEEEDGVDPDDPTWWAPHAVLAALVLIGVAGFFGAFNSVLGKYGAKPAGGETAAHSEAAAPAHKEEAKPAGVQNIPNKQGATPPSPKPAPPVPADVKAPPADAKKTPSGLAYKVIKPGNGKSPAATDSVTVNYTGWTTDGKMFDSSITRGQPATFRLNQVIKGWTEGVPLMKTGETTRFWIPADLAYGEKPMRPGAPAGMLVFDVELISVNN